jgi:hypothetical protein
MAYIDSGEAVHYNNAFPARTREPTGQGNLYFRENLRLKGALKNGIGWD